MSRAETKVCEQCSETYERKYQTDDRNWKQQRFCSRTCAWDSQRKDAKAPPVERVGDEQAGCERLNEACWAIYAREARLRRLGHPLEAAVMMGMLA